MIEVPILYLIFNRLEETQQSFASIKQAKPKYLFIAADGPRIDKKGESQICKEIREYVLNEINWECELKTLFRENNLGCGLAVSGAITWFFENVEMGLIIEDDIVCSPDFFIFSSYILNRYRYHPKVFGVKGTHLINKRSKYSYHFSRFPSIWGWGTWKECWMKYNYEPEIDDNKIKKYFSPLKDVGYYFIDFFKKTDFLKIDTWDYQWFYCVIENGGLVAEPSLNLVSNIGFSENATHTKEKSKINFKNEFLELPYSDSTVKSFNSLDLEHFKINNYSNESLSKVRRLFDKILFHLNL